MNEDEQGDTEDVISIVKEIREILLGGRLFPNYPRREMADVGAMLRPGYTTRVATYTQMKHPLHDLSMGTRAIDEWHIGIWFELDAGRRSREFIFQL